MPAMINCPVSSSVKTRNVGSSSDNRCNASDILSRSAFELGSTAIEMTGSGKVGGSSITSSSLSHKVSPVVTLRSPTMAAMSPEYTAFTSVRLSACNMIRRLTRSRLRVRGL